MLFLCRLFPPFALSDRSLCKVAFSLPRDLVRLQELLMLKRQRLVILCLLSERCQLVQQSAANLVGPRMCAYSSVFRVFEGAASFSPAKSPPSIRLRTLMSFPSALRHVAR